MGASKQAISGSRPQGSQALASFRRRRFRRHPGNLLRWNPGDIRLTLIGADAVEYQGCTLVE